MGRQVHADVDGGAGVAQRIGSARQVGRDAFDAADRAARKRGDRGAIEDHAQGIVAGGAGDAERIGSGAAAVGVDAVAEGVAEAVVAVAAQAAYRCRLPPTIVSLPAPPSIESGANAAEQLVVTVSTKEGVVARATVDAVVAEAGTAIEHVVARRAGDAVAAQTADHVLERHQHVLDRGRGGATLGRPGGEIDDQGIRLADVGDGIGTGTAGQGVDAQSTD